MAPSVLFVLTSADKLLDGSPTGWFLPEAAHPYYALHDKAEIIWASPKGGKAPLDPGSVEFAKDDAESQKFLKDEKAKAGYEHTKKLSEIDPAKFDAIFYVGGHGPVLDLATDKESIKLAETFYQSGRPTAAVCHGPAALHNVKGKDGKSIFAGREATAFSNVEEEQVQKVDKIPFLPEESIKQNGGTYVKASDAWGEKVVVSKNADGILITGQNPSSATAVGKAILEALQKA